MKAIVITSIFEPTPAVVAFAQIPGYHLIVIGDSKSPAGWECRNALYMDTASQQQLGLELARKLPYNHYSRKMLGYLYAVRLGATQIVDTDDDNIPKDGWSFPGFEPAEYSCVSPDLGFVNVYQLYTAKNIWPRGLPLNLIKQNFRGQMRLSKRQCSVGIWQGLADGDPDVDAIYRLTCDDACYFEERPPTVLGKGTICPFNTQNTVIRRELFPLLYLPTFVTFRFTDILRGLVAQPIMWNANYQLGFVSANVVQNRNPHDYMKDFASEVPMYEWVEAIPRIVSSAICPTEGIKNNLLRAYVALQSYGIVSQDELQNLRAWLLDLDRCSAAAVRRDLATSEER